MQKSPNDAFTPLLIPQNWRQNNIGFIRLVLAIMVIFSHAFTLLDGNSDREPVFALFPGFASFGRLAVVGFFAISGLLISESWIRRPVLKEFVLRRVLRIWPGFVAASFVMLLLVVPIGTDRPAAYVASLCSGRVVLGHLARAAMLQQPSALFGFETNPIPRVIDGSLWTIVYEFTWYGVVAAFGIGGLVAKRKPMLSLAACVLLIYIAVYQRGGRLTSVGFAGITLDSWLAYGSSFSMGMLALAFKEKIPRSTLLFGIALLSFVTAHFHPKLMLVLLPTSYVYILFWFCFSPVAKLAGIGGKNDLSYGFYLYAFGLEQLLIYRFHWIRSPYLLFFLATALTAPFALFSWFCVERPAKDLFKPSGEARRRAVRDAEPLK